MPVEIKELIIKMRVEEQKNTQQPKVDVKALQSQIALQVREEVQKQLKRLDER